MKKARLLSVFLLVLFIITTLPAGCKSTKTSGTALPRTSEPAGTAPADPGITVRPTIIPTRTGTSPGLPTPTSDPSQTGPKTSSAAPSGSTPASGTNTKTPGQTSTGPATSAATTTSKTNPPATTAPTPVPTRQPSKTTSYSFTVNTSGLYDFRLNIPVPANVKTKWNNTVWYVNNETNFKIPLPISLKDNGSTFLGTLYLESGNNTLYITNPGALLTDDLLQADLNVLKADVYEYPRLKLSEKWMYTLYNTSYNGWVEAQGWDDMWTHCQYLGEKLIYSDLSGNTKLYGYAKSSADNFLINKMLMSDGAVHTVYQGITGEYEVSIEPSMEKGIWDLWRGNSAFIEEMLLSYKEFGDSKYLNNAIKAGNYILNSWSTNFVGGVGNVYTDRTQRNGLYAGSVGRAIMALSQLYTVTKDTKWLNAAKQQGEAILHAQTSNGLFNSGITGGWQHGNAYCNSLSALAWLYRITGDAKYLNAIDKAITGLKNIWSDGYGFIPLSSPPPYNDITTYVDGSSTYLLGRIGQAIFTAAYFTNNKDYYRMGEKLLYMAFGRNYAMADLQNKANGSYYYGITYRGGSNIETSSEVNMGTLQVKLLQKYWHK